MMNETLKACFRDEELFNEAVQLAKSLKQQPNNMALRHNVRLWCQQKHLPEPQFKKQEDPIINNHEIFNEPLIAEWINGKIISWHQHKDCNFYHISCQCNCTFNSRDCTPIKMDSETFKRAIQNIKHRGQLRANLPSMNRCYPVSFIRQANGSINVTYKLNSNEFVSKNIPANQPHQSQPEGKTQPTEAMKV